MKYLMIFNKIAFNKIVLDKLLILVGKYLY